MNLDQQANLTRQERAIVSRISRRTFMGATAAATLGALSGREPSMAQAQSGRPNATADAVIVLWMAGGMAQTETFDPKRYTPFAPGVRTDRVLSTFPGIDTAVDTIKISQGLERVARVMDRGARSPLWRQIVADVLGRPIEYAPGADLGSAWGVAWVAGVAAGCWDWERSGTGARSADPPPVVHAPVPEHTARYERLYRIYRGLYPALRGETR